MLFTAADFKFSHNVSLRNLQHDAHEFTTRFLLMVFEEIQNAQSLLSTTVNPNPLPIQKYYHMDVIITTTCSKCHHSW